MSFLLTNMLNGALLTRFGCSTVWSAPNAHVTNLLKCGKPKHHPKPDSTEKTLITLQSNVHKHLSLTRPALYTQIRFQKYPRYHRDIEFPNFDEYRKSQFADTRKTKWGQGDEKPGLTYAISFGVGVMAMYSAKSIATYLASSMSAAADVLALSTIEVNLSKIARGTCDIVKWRGKPLFIKHRSEADIASDSSDSSVTGLRDPESVEKRVPNPNYLIVIGICTHLGCVPIPNSGDYPGGYYCPCHGSHYDNLGRIRKGPAPLNLVIPPYKYITDTTVLIG